MINVLKINCGLLPCRAGMKHMQQCHLVAMNHISAYVVTCTITLHRISSWNFIDENMLERLIYFKEFYSNMFKNTHNYTFSFSIIFDEE